MAATGTTLLARAEVDGTRLIASLTFEGWGPAILPATAVPSYLLDRWALVKVTEIPRRLIGVVQRATGLPSAPAACGARPLDRHRLRPFENS